ncbi:TIGR00730 family Rossman fold protein [Tautonia sp. JC769]|uniref:LOG family protein n=1 Tax=Tautonia sp. JC769 TaxID=3232135 RepID=UPI003457745A
MQSVCVFCGSSPGADPAYRAAAVSMGRLLAEQGRTLVYGGGSVGLMGVLADAALEHGGDVVGVIPQSLLDREVGHRELPELHVVGSMHERKAMMAELADGFLAMPGGIGTLEEFFEIWTWGQLGLHRKPFGLLDVEGFYQPMLGFLDRMVEQRFVRPEHRAMLIVARQPVTLLAAMEAYTPPPVPNWIDREAT